MAENVHNVWKCSSYTNIFNINENFLLFSTINGRLIKFTPDQFEIIQAVLESVRDTGTAGNIEILQLLAAQLFIVPLGFDERENAHKKYLSTINNSKHLIMVISPTMKCNFSCSYCFEKNAVKYGEMSLDVQEKLIKLVENMIIKEGRLDVQWFGGEPYLAFEVIEYLTGRFQNICKVNGAKYEAGIITNGSLFDMDNIMKLNRLNISSMQITLDGTPETFARYKGVSLLESKEFYSKIFLQIPLLLQQLKSLTIRINIDRDNYQESFYVIQELKKRSLNDAKIDLRLGLLEGKNNIVDCIPHSCLSTEEYIEFDLRFKEYLVQEGFAVYGFPMPLPYPCATVKKHSYSIDPLGNIYHCVPETGQGLCVYGNLDGIDEIKSNEYQDFDPWVIPACRDCSLLPICLGRCPRRQKYENPYKCLTKFKLAERLLLYSNGAK